MELFEKKMMKFVIQILVFSSIIGLGSSFASEDVYQWKDDKGVNHYTQTPPLDRPYKVIKGKESKVNPSSYRPKRNQPTANTNNQTNAPQSEIERYQAVRKHNCNVAQKNLLTLTNVARIRVTGSDGEERLLTDAEKKEKIALSKQQVKNFCSKEFNKSKDLYPDPNDPDAPRKENQ